MTEKTNYKNKEILIVIDLSLIIISYILAFHLRFNEIPERNWDAFVSLSPWIILISLFFIAMYEVHLLYQKSKWDIILNVIVSSTLIMFLIIASSFLFREFGLPRSVILLAYLIGTTLLISWKLFLIQLQSKKNDVILFIGDKDEKQKVIKHLNMPVRKNVRMKYLSANESIDAIVPVLLFADQIIIGSTVLSELKSKIIYQSVKKGKIVYVIPTIHDLLLSRSIITNLDDTMVMTVKPFGFSWAQKAVKRAYDLIAAFITLLLFSPLMFIVGMIIKLNSPKEVVFYKQLRAGKNNKKFLIYKFRSMVEGAESKTGPILAEKNDPRVTRIGKFLRQTRLDELPQLFNVLKGDMSIVGPRPEREHFIKQFEKSFDSYQYRSTVKPGITGYAQIMGKYTTKVEDKLRFDLFYIRNYSFLLDLIIQFRTIIILLDKRKAEGNRETKSTSAVKRNVF